MHENTDFWYLKYNKIILVMRILVFDIILFDSDVIFFFLISYDCFENTLVMLRNVHNISEIAILFFRQEQKSVCK